MHQLRPGDESALALPSLDEAHPLQVAKRLRGSSAADIEGRTELALRRDLLARLPLPGLDLVAEQLLELVIEGRTSFPSG